MGIDFAPLLVGLRLLVELAGDQSVIVGNDIEPLPLGDAVAQLIGAREGYVGAARFAHVAQDGSQPGVGHGEVRVQLGCLLEVGNGGCLALFIPFAISLAVGRECIERGGGCLVQRHVKAADRIQRFSQPGARGIGHLVEYAQHGVAIADLLAAGKDHRTVGAVIDLNADLVALPVDPDAALNHGGAIFPLADLQGNVQRQPFVVIEPHIAQGLHDLLRGHQVQIRRLLQLGFQRRVQCIVKLRISGRVHKVCHHDRRLGDGGNLRMEMKPIPAKHQQGQTERNASAQCPSGLPDRGRPGSLSAERRRRPALRVRMELRGTAPAGLPRRTPPAVDLGLPILPFQLCNRLLELCGRADPLARIPRQALPQQHIPGTRKRRRVAAGLGWFVSQPLERRKHLGAAFKGVPAGEHLEENQTQGIDIAGRRELAALNLLRRHVLRGSEDGLSAARQGVVAGGAGAHSQSKVRNHGSGACVIVRLEEDIRGLQIAVDDAGLVGGRQCIRHRMQNRQRLLRIERTALPEYRGECSALQQLHADEEQIGLSPMARRVTEEIVDATDIGMGDTPGELHLAPKAVHGLGKAKNLRPDGLDGDPGLELLILDLVDLTHAAVRQKGDDPEAASEQRTRLKAGMVLHGGRSGIGRGRQRRSGGGIRGIRCLQGILLQKRTGLIMRVKQVFDALSQGRIQSGRVQNFALLIRLFFKGQQEELFDSYPIFLRDLHDR